MAPPRSKLLGLSDFMLPYFMYFWKKSLYFVTLYIDNDAMVIIMSTIIILMAIICILFFLPKKQTKTMEIGEVRLPSICNQMTRGL